MTVQDFQSRRFKSMTIHPLAYTKDNVTFTVTLPETHTEEVHIPTGYKVSITGRFCIERHEGSVKYPEEAILNVFGYAEVIPGNFRNDMSMDRFEGPVNLHEFYFTICETKRKLEDYFRSKKRRS